MILTGLKAKIHRAVLTSAELHYEGSIAIDKNLCKSANILEYEQVDIYNCTNGVRFTTYVIYSDKSDEVSVKGAAARLVQAGDVVIIAAYAQFTPEELSTWKPTVVLR
jgi:aspartate 1-decarboxylase